MDDQPTTTALLLDIQHKVGNTNEHLARLNGQVATLTAYKREHELHHAEIKGRTEATLQWGARTWVALTLLVSLSGVISGILIKVL